MGSHPSWRCSLLLTGIFLVLGILSLLLGISGLFFVPDLIKQGVKQKTFLAKEESGEDNRILKMLRDPPYDVQMEIWTVSVQNPQAVKDGAEPVVVEKGPYTYSMRLHKSNLTFGANPSRLFLRQQKHFHFSQSLSCPDCRLTDLVTVPNLIFQKVVDMAEGHNWFVRQGLEGILKLFSEGPFLQITVDELLFAGYKDKMVDKMCKAFPKQCQDVTIPERIGLFYGQNGTDDGLYEVDTGLEDPNLLAKVYSFNGMKGKLTDKFWYKPEARLINGTDGELFGPDITDGRKLEIFLGPLCRSFELEKRETLELAGFPIFRYGWPESMLDASVQRSQGFCNPNSPDYFENNSKIQESGCAPSGLLDMSSCFPGNPRLFWSNAHFRNGDKKLRLKGMAEASENDLSYFDIEPVTAAIVGVQQKFQLSAGVLRGPFGMTKKMPNLIVPMLLVNQSAKMDSGTREQLQTLHRTFFYSFNGGIGLVILGLLLVIAAVGFLLLAVINSRKPKEVFVRSRDEVPVDDPNGSNATNSTILS